MEYQSKKDRKLKLKIKTEVPFFIYNLHCRTELPVAKWNFTLLRLWPQMAVTMSDETMSFSAAGTSCQLQPY
jgi:hypothetical protein